MAYWKDTPSHGWLILSKSELEQIPEFARRDKYEEDCEWSIAAVALPSILKNIKNFPQGEEYMKKTAHERCRDWYPEIFEKLTGEKATPENSRMMADRKFHEDNKDNFVVISAIGDHSHKFTGFVLCEATLGGIRGGWKDGERITPVTKVFLVKNEVYANRGNNGHVVTKEDIAIDSQDMNEFVSR